MLKKLIKFVVIGLLVVVVGGGAAIAFMVRTPDPEAICTNLFDLTQEEMSVQLAAGLGKDRSDVGNMTREDAAETLGMTFERCVEKTEFRLENSTRGMIPLAKEARCQASAKTLKAFEDC
jgi:hypothetical protein